MTEFLGIIKGVPEEKFDESKIKLLAYAQGLTDAYKN